MELLSINFNVPVSAHKTRVQYIKLALFLTLKRSVFRQVMQLSARPTYGERQSDKNRFSGRDPRIRESVLRLALASMIIKFFIRLH